MQLLVNYDILHQRTSVKFDGKAMVVRALITSALGHGCDDIHLLVLLGRMLCCPPVNHLSTYVLTYVCMNIVIRITPIDGGRLVAVLGLTQ